MIVFNHDSINKKYKIHGNNNKHNIIKRSVKPSRRKTIRKITKKNKEFLKALGFKV